MRFACTAVALLLGLFPSPGAAFSPPKPALGSKRKNCNVVTRSSPCPRNGVLDADDGEATGGDGAGEPMGRWPVAAGILGMATANLHATRALAEGTVGLAGVVATGLLSDGDPGAPAVDVPKEAIIELTATPSGTATVVSDTPPPKAPETKPPSAIAAVSVEKAAAPSAEKASGDKALDKVENVGAVLGAITDQKIAGAKDTALAAGGKAVALQKQLSPTKAPPLAAFEAVTLVATVAAAIATATVVAGYVFASDEARDEGKGEWRADAKPVPYGLQDATPEYSMPAGMGGNTERVPKEPPSRAVEAKVASKGAEKKGAAPSSASEPAVPKKAAGAVLKGGPATSPPQAGGGISMANLLKGSAAKKTEATEWKADAPAPYGRQDGAAAHAKPATLQAQAAAEVKESLVVPKKKSAPPKFDEGVGIGAAAALKAARTAVGLKGAVSDGPAGGPAGGIPAAKASGGPKKSFSKSRWKGSGGGGGGMLKSGAPGGASTMAVPASKLGEGISMATLVKGAVAKQGSAAVAPTKKSFAKSSFKPSGVGGKVPGSGGPALSPDVSKGAEAAAVEMEGASRKASSTAPSPPKWTEAGPVAGAKSAPTKKSFAKASFKTSGSSGTVPGAYRVGGGPPPPASARGEWSCRYVKEDADGGLKHGVEAAAAEMEVASRKASASSSPLGGGMLKGQSSGAGAGRAPGFGKGGAGWLKGKPGSSGGGMLKGTNLSPPSHAAPSPATTPAFSKMKESYAKTGSAKKGAAPKSPSTGGFLSNLEQAAVPANGRSAPPAVETAPRPLPVKPQPAPPAASPASVPAGRTTAPATTANGRVVPRSIGEFHGARAVEHGVRASVGASATAGRPNNAAPPAQPPAYTNTVYAAPAPSAPAARAPTERPDGLDGRAPPGRAGTADEGKGPPLSVTITDPRTGKKRTVRASSNANSS